MIYSETYLSFEEMIKDPPFRWVWGLDRIGENFPEAKTILDVGTGKGHFVIMARGRKYDAFGFDLNMREKHESVPIMNPNLNPDVITMFQVLEHVKGPGEFLKNYFEKVRDGVIFTVPIENKLDDPGHINHFSFYDLYDLSSSLTGDFEIQMINKFRKTAPETNLFGIILRK